jgi:hypothetical protein
MQIIPAWRLDSPRQPGCQIHAAPLSRSFDLQIIRDLPQVKNGPPERPFAVRAQISLGLKQLARRLHVAMLPGVSCFRDDLEFAATLLAANTVVRIS